jgi:hypothetical protein
MANDERDALDALEKEAKEYDKARNLCILPVESVTNLYLGCRDRPYTQSI